MYFLLVHLVCFIDRRMTVHFSTETTAQIQNAVHVLHMSEDSFLERAIHYYVDALDKEMKLKQEFGEWENLSDEALLHFETHCAQNP